MIYNTGFESLDRPNLHRTSSIEEELDASSTRCTHAASILRKIGVSTSSSHSTVYLNKYREVVLLVEVGISAEMLNKLNGSQLGKLIKAAQDIYIAVKFEGKAPDQILVEYTTSSPSPNIKSPELKHPTPFLLNFERNTNPFHFSEHPHLPMHQKALISKYSIDLNYLLSENVIQSSDLENIPPEILENLIIHKQDMTAYKKLGVPLTFLIYPAFFNIRGGHLVSYHTVLKQALNDNKITKSSFSAMNPAEFIITLVKLAHPDSTIHINEQGIITESNSQST